jgi:hypothetical protein
MLGLIVLNITIMCLPLGPKIGVAFLSQLTLDSVCVCLRGDCLYFILILYLKVLVKRYI